MTKSPFCRRAVTCTVVLDSIGRLHACYVIQSEPHRVTIRSHNFWSVGLRKHAHANMHRISTEPRPEWQLHYVVKCLKIAFSKSWYSPWREPASAKMLEAIVRISRCQWTACGHVSFARPKLILATRQVYGRHLDAHTTCPTVLNYRTRQQINTQPCIAR